MGMSLPLWLAAAEPAGWADVPVAQDLHPVAWDYGARYQALLARSMGGPSASSVFGPVVAEADVHWRLVAATGRGLPMDEGTEELWSAVATTGSLMAVEALVNETFERAPRLHVVFVAADAVVNPSLRVQRKPQGVTVDHPVGKVRSDVAREAELEDVPHRRANPTFDAGLDWALRDDDAPEEAPPVTWRAYVSTSETLLSQLRLEYGLTDQSWSATGRERVRPRLYLTGTIRSVPREAVAGLRAPDELLEPGRWSAGLLWELPWRTGWTVRLDRTTTLADESVTWMVSLRGENHSPIPVRPSRRHDATPTFPALRDRGPNRVGTW